MKRFWKRYDQSASIEKLEIGQLAPDFSLPDQHDRIVSRADFHSRWLVIYFYPKDFTPGCTLEAREFRDALSELTALNAAIIGISLDRPDTHASFARRHGLEFPLLTDRKGRVAAAYGALSSFFGLLKFARRQTFLVAPEGRIAVIFHPVHLPGHARQLIESVRQLQSK